jgi:7,8-dihydroneopterin aldolase/epimerase/oxygenase
VDIIYLHDLKVDCIIGLWDWERKVRQRIVIDLDMAADIRKSAKSDAIEDTLDYKAVSKAVISFVGESEFQLVETLAEKIADIILNDFQVPWVRVKINKKGAIRGASDVGVIIERGDNNA